MGSKKIIIRLALLFVFVLFNMSSFQGCIKRGDLYDGNPKGPDYYPLEVGNSWEYENISYKKSTQKTSRYSNVIVNKQDNGNGVTEFFRKNEKSFLMKSSEGILTPSGSYILKYPLSFGTAWVSGDTSDDQRLFRVDESGFSISIQGNTYHKCIRIIEMTNFFQTPGDGAYRALETTGIFAPNVGPVLYEVHEVKKSGERRRLSRSELLSFKTNQCTAPPKPPGMKQPRLIEEKESFRFPKKCFRFPSLSPDEKWLFYRRTFCDFWSKKEWDREMFYTQAGYADEKRIPFCPEKERKNVRIAEGYPLWSPDSKILATFYTTDDFSDWIGLVDFSGDTPRHIESFKATKPFFWISERTFLYLSEYRSIMKKSPGERPEPIGLPCSVNSFTIASEGTIIHTDNDNSVFLTNVSDPSKRTPLYCNPEKSKHKSLELSYGYDISPKGDYAIFRLFSHEIRVKKIGALVDLRKVEIIDRFPLRSGEKFKWSPDGTKVAYHEDTVVQMDSEDPKKLMWPAPHFLSWI